MAIFKVNAHPIHSQILAEADVLTVRLLLQLRLEDGPFSQENVQQLQIKLVESIWIIQHQGIMTASIQPRRRADGTPEPKIHLCKEALLNWR